MEVSELVKIKPGTIIWATIQELTVDEDNLLLANNQEVCLRVKSAIFFPSRKECGRIDINIDPIELSGETEYTILQKIEISLEGRHIFGVIELKESGDILSNDVLISSIELE